MSIMATLKHVQSLESLIVRGGWGEGGVLCLILNRSWHDQLCLSFVHWTISTCPPFLIVFRSNVISVLLLLFAESAFEHQTTIVVTAFGKVEFQDSKPKGFYQTFILSSQANVWKIVSDNFRFMETVSSWPHCPVEVARDRLCFMGTFVSCGRLSVTITASWRPFLPDLKCPVEVARDSCCFMGTFMSCQRLSVTITASWRPFLPDLCVLWKLGVTVDATWGLFFVSFMSSGRLSVTITAFWRPSLLQCPVEDCHWQMPLMGFFSSPWPSSVHVVEDCQ